MIEPGVTERVESNLLWAVGSTPLIELTEILDLPRAVRVFGKLESCNPGGSIKDRPVSRMLLRGLAEGCLQGGKRVLDSSSGNAGIAYAQFGAALGVGVTLVVPGNASRERLERIAAHGAELILTDPVEGYDFALLEARRLADRCPQRYWHCDQYANPNNALSHYEGTGEEILAQVRLETGRQPDAFVAGIGTGGTITGVGRRLKEAHPAARVIAVIPEDFPGIEGLKPLGRPGDIVPDILDEDLIDWRLTLSLDEAVGVSRQLARAGLFVGPSSGACVAAAKRIAAGGNHSVVVTVLSDGGERYGSTGMWSRS